MDSGWYARKNQVGASRVNRGDVPANQSLSPPRINRLGPIGQSIVHQQRTDSGPLANPKAPRERRVQVPLRGKYLGKNLRKTPDSSLTPSLPEKKMGHSAIIRYKPYNLLDYRAIRPNKYVAFGGLGPDLNSESWTVANIKRERMRRYGELFKIAHE